MHEPFVKVKQLMLHPGGGWAVPIMTFTERLHPKGIPFQSPGV